MKGRNCEEGPYPKEIFISFGHILRQAEGKER